MGKRWICSYGAKQREYVPYRFHGFISYLILIKFDIGRYLLHQGLTYDVLLIIA
ncbi:unnamed protein product [Wuchereria bancrofti]|uniref:Uncharacterized protein n=1 Tax=Wuchereria bancrofti TaxID=6293 RepID=A0A3P7ED74_WUCBA|nr:unnamed protein product [Wuchereria bancrofti]